MIKIHNVKMTYPNGDGLDHINLEVRNGEFVYLVGPTGAGKSSVLKIIYMEEFPTEGYVVVDKYNSMHVRNKEIPHLRRKIGIIFQDFKLLEDRDVFENVAFALRVTGARLKDIKRKTLRALAEVGLSHKSRKMTTELSGGEQQRVAIARAIVNEPFVLLADEPTGNLDPKTAVEIMNILDKLNARGTAVLMATHNYELVNSTFKRVVSIRNGRTLS
ncbi:cell division ATP-binding protein FtsE [candidate division KSB1 bacterium]|nr:cell division ATP-binding protein FtsE [candidate division KSB1 bacterium]NIR71343.1 cell division ATP-binding protein FtsE [candidate division KSB1 bacterium]NIS26233.1 cell division ATP-binding protein FtsE [candidate division KSB1 bacterium]NIT74663.1 cell division ATP-binding protein FtsE [candidate division KSB1 bacterium]NIU26881.1 cell division ATP-binding protein FtsE [candidate division KSB1 bacterium]